MTSITYLLVATALCATPDATLLCFRSETCPPCRTMGPVIQRLKNEGYAIREVDVARSPDLAEKHRVEGVPCFVFVVDGEEVDRVVGLTSIARLQKMFETSERTTKAPASKSAAVANSAPPAKAASHGAGSKFAAQLTSRTPPGNRPATKSNSAIVQRALEATVRIRVDDAGGQSWGTGTIIDVHDDEALIVTCGHLFRDSKGKGKITVDLYAPGAKEPVAGQLIGYESESRDIGLIAIRPGVPVRPAMVVAPDYRTAPGDDVFSIGCDKGANPSVRTSQITSIDKYLGAPNIEVAGQPVDGRSGGGLFSADGQLIAICNAADPKDNEGVYASWPNIHWQLAQVGLQRLFEGSQVASRSPSARKNTPPAAPPVMANQMANGGSDRGPAEFGTSRLGSAERSAAGARTDREPTPPRGSVPTRNVAVAASEPIRGGDSDTEIIVIVRSKRNPASPGQTIVLNEPSAEFMTRLDQEQRSRMESRVPDRLAERPSPAPRAAFDRSGPVIRAQSDD